MSLISHIALLRGINVGGNHKLTMKELVRIFKECGAQNVETYIQSGNAVFDSEPDQATEICSKVERSIEEQFGFPAPIILRNSDQLHKITHSNPYLVDIQPEEILYVCLLRDNPTLDQIAKLDHVKFLPDKFELIGQEIYLRYDKGAGKTKLTNLYFDKCLSTISTMRNWRTICTLAGMAGTRI
jgi:uncharacterized protein (DUF1697 family)